MLRTYRATTEMMQTAAVPAHEAVSVLDCQDEVAGSCDAEDERLRDEGRCRFIVRW